MSVTTIKAAKAAKNAEAEESSDAKAKGKGKGKGKKVDRKRLVMILAAALAVAGAAYWFLLKPSAPADEAPKPGHILQLDSTQINLASGHYLKIGIALQLVEGAPEEVDGSKALDATIDLFSGLTIEEVATTRDRRALKEELESTLEKSYDDEVMGVYFTEFVTQ